jgi:hypothetical protein
MQQVAYAPSAVERAMKVQEVILRAVDGRLKWYQAAEILGISDRQMRRWKWRYEQWGYDGLFDWCRQQSSPERRRPHPQDPSHDRRRALTQAGSPWKSPASLRGEAETIAQSFRVTTVR